MNATPGEAGPRIDIDVSVEVASPSTGRLRLAIAVHEFTTTHAPKLDAACALLLGLLRDGPRRWTDIQDAAHEAHISDRTMDTAKAALGVTSQQIPEPGSRGRGPSWWTLPGADRTAQPTTDTSPVPDKEQP